MYFDYIEIIIKTAYRVEISHIVRYISILFKNIWEHKRVLKILPEQMNIRNVSTNDKRHKQTEDKMICAPLSV